MKLLQKILPAAVFAYVIILSIVFFEIFIRRYPISFQSSLSFSFVYWIPVVTMIWYTKRFQDQHPESGRIYFAAPLFSIIPSVISTIFWVFLVVLFSETAEAGMIVFFVPILLLISITLYAALSFFVVMIIRSRLFVFKMVLVILGGCIPLITLIMGVFYWEQCGGAAGCTDNHLACIAYLSHNSDMCERMVSRNTEPAYPLLSVIKANIGNSSNCYQKLAYLENNPLLCEKAEFAETWCYTYFIRRSTESFCDRFTNPDSRSNCYYSFAILLWQKELCSNVHPTRNQPMDAGGCRTYVEWLSGPEGRPTPTPIASTPDCKQY